MSESFSEAGRRHRNDAKHLAANERFQNAGHLIGFAAECLVKEVLQNAGIQISDKTELRQHFPHLAIALRGYGRQMGALSSVVNDKDFLQRWRADLRYEENIASPDAQARWTKWLADVESLFITCGRP